MLVLVLGDKKNIPTMRRVHPNYEEGGKNISKNQKVVAMELTHATLSLYAAKKGSSSGLFPFPVS